MQWSVLFSCLLVGLSVSAKPEAAKVKEKDLLFPSDTIDLTQKAREESAAPGVKQQRASDAQIGSESGIFVLQDPGLTPVVSPWIFQLELRAQRFTPGGKATMGNNQTFDIGAANAFTMPILDFGVKRRIVQGAGATWFGTLRAEAGYNRQGTEVYFPGGAQAPDTKLATALYAGSLLASARFDKFRNWEWELGYERGIVSYTQSSGNSAATFSAGSHFHGYVAGVYYWPTDSLAIGLEQAKRSLDDNNGITIPSDNTSLGVRFEW